ncbi:hypothetical protein C440_11658 [Haloferax mucosum ATCC BAA-1512]|uniref:Transcriptional initiation protein Tat n=1 Tax=Haloferax mucosum ATCC BAA-1512 TaxID=662479 RepID=M0IBU7_9EURY|nr:hypothetical protein [Haloferax mucosum]ELZ94275.1 hypothetical protein C440_11658 [Haloferax mucosum ATCC BAA-1512]
MVPDSPLSRRRLLTGGATVLGAGLVGTGWFAPTWFPDVVTDKLLAVYPEPPKHVWRPEVSDEHADDAVARLERTVEQVRTLRSRIDLDSVSDEMEFRLNGDDPSGGWLETAKSESEPRDRLFDALYGLSFAGEALGAAKVTLGETDPEAVVERGDRLRADARAVLDSVASYEVSDPATDLAYLYFVERDLAFARLNSHRDGVFTGGTAGADDYSPQDVANTWSSHLQAEQYLANARYYRDLYRENLGDETRSYAETLDDAHSTLTEQIESLPTRSDVRERIEGERGFDHQTPLGAARWELFWMCFDTDYRIGYDSDGPHHGHTVQRVVETASALLNRRAHEFALDELDVSPGDTDYDSGRTFRAKRRAVSRFRSVRAKYDSPFAGVLAQQAASLIHSGEVGIEMADGTHPMWLNRVEATTYYLVSAGQMNELGSVYETIIDGS